VGRGRRAASQVRMAAGVGQRGQGVYNNAAEIIW
jgi:hypothetical protein